MPRKALGDHPLTAAERQARQRARNAKQSAALREMLRHIISAKTLREARQLAADALSLGMV